MTSDQIPNTGHDDSFVNEINHAFQRNLRFWALRWTIGLSAMAWFSIQFPQHWWVVLIGIGMATVSLLVLVVGRRIVLNRHQRP